MHAGKVVTMNDPHKHVSYTPKRIPERWFPGKFDIWVSSTHTSSQHVLIIHPQPVCIPSNLPYARSCCRDFSLPWRHAGHDLLAYQW